MDGDRAFRDVATLGHVDVLLDFLVVQLLLLDGLLQLSDFSLAFRGSRVGLDDLRDKALVFLLQVAEVILFVVLDVLQSQIRGAARDLL